MLAALIFLMILVVFVTQVGKVSGVIAISMTAYLIHVKMPIVVLTWSLTFDACVREDLEGKDVR